MPAAKTTASKRTTTKRAPAVPSFDAERAKIVKDRKPEPPKKWKAYGQVWTVKAPNFMLTAQMLAVDDDEDEDGNSVGYFTTYILAHVVKAERKDFLKALLADDDLDIDVATAMVGSLSKVVYD